MGKPATEQEKLRQAKGALPPPNSCRAPIRAHSHQPLSPTFRSGLRVDPDDLQDPQAAANGQHSAPRPSSPPNFGAGSTNTIIVGRIWPFRARRPLSACANSRSLDQLCRRWLD